MMMTGMSRSGGNQQARSRSGSARPTCPCGADLADAVDLGVVDRYQQHEVPPVSVTVTQYDQHAAA
jgi:hypothetical protein